MKTPTSSRAARFTGERLHAGSALFAADLARHAAVYRYARSTLEDRPAQARPAQARPAQARRALDLGCGSGYGTRLLASAVPFVAGLDRVAPDPEPASAGRPSGPSFVVADLLAVPFRPGSFSAVVSLQVLEHLARPAPYLATAAGLLEAEGLALLSTPNRLTSEGVNPHHAHEYTARELASLLASHFRHVELRAVGATERARRYQDTRRRHVERLLRLDVLRLRERLPRPLAERAFGLLALVVRLLVRRELDPGSITWEDYPIGPYHDDCLDLVALCRR